MNNARVALACSALIALVCVPLAAAKPDPRFEPGESLTTWSSGNDLLYLKVVRTDDGSEITIGCDSCKKVYQERLDGLGAQGAFILSHHGNDDVNLATLWLSGSREVLIIYNVSSRGVREVLSEAMNFPPTFSSDGQGREEVAIPRDVDVGIGETHPQAITVYTWDGMKFVPREKAWADLLAK
jgi:hypothetical protein